jgi:hypothetical protein
MGMTFDTNRRDRILGATCLIVCPAISGLFLGFVAVLCTLPLDRGHSIAVGIVVGAITFLVNIAAISLTASTLHAGATRRARRAARETIDLAA